MSTWDLKLFMIKKEDMTGVYIVKTDIEMSVSKEAHTKY